jgi:ketosteroid isomerase-like protein
MPEAVDARRHAPAADIKEVLRLHKEWWEANITGDIPRMVKAFPSPGDDYLMFNVTGHTYFGMQEKIRVWEYYGALMSESPVDMRVLRLEVRGDTAWLAAEGTVEPRDKDGRPLDEAVPVEQVRSTEIYHRDDGEGRPAWRMWHFHASIQSPPGDPRPAFEDVAEERALGATPWAPLPAGDA